LGEALASLFAPSPELLTLINLCAAGAGEAAGRGPGAAGSPAAAGGRGTFTGEGVMNPSATAETHGKHAGDTVM